MGCCGRWKTPPGADSEQRCDIANVVAAPLRIPTLMSPRRALHRSPQTPTIAAAARHRLPPPEDLITHLDDPIQVGAAGKAPSIGPAGRAGHVKRGRIPHRQEASASRRLSRLGRPDRHSNHTAPMAAHHTSPRGSHLGGFLRPVPAFAPGIADLDASGVIEPLRLIGASRPPAVAYSSLRTFRCSDQTSGRSVRRERRAAVR
jgi:hypothetical protein